MARNSNRALLRSWIEKRSRSRSALAVLGVAALVGSALAGVSTAAQAAPGTPGTPQANTVVFEENFENGPGTAPQGLADYTGAGGQTYTADDVWLTACNGIIVNFTIPATSRGNCSTTNNSTQLRQLAYALGEHSNAATPAANDVVAAYTENNPGANAVEFQTVSNIPLAQASGRFLTFSVDTAAVNCAVSAPQYQFAFLNEGGAATNVGGLLNACASGTTVPVPAVGALPARDINVGTYTSNGSLLFSGSSLGIRMTNANGSGVGNDAAFDNIRILDVTPQLDKSFSPASLVAGEVSTLTLTITNTADLAAKNGWSLTDALPAGLTIADGTATTTCPAGVVTAPVGGTSVTTSGNLTAGMASCEVTVNVTSPVAGSFTNGPDNITSVGLNPPAESTVEFVEQAPAISVVKSATPNSEEEFTVGQEVTYSFLVTNTGNVALTDVDVTDGEFTGTGELSDVVCPAGAANLAPAADVTCTATYTVTQADVDAGSITNSATATGTPPEGTPPVSPPSEVTIPSNAPAPALTIVKSSDVETISEAGETITYSFLVTNTGNVTLNDVAVTETDFSGTGELSPIVCPEGAASLAPGADVTCTATYTVTQADVDAGSITNIASVTGTPPNPLTPPPVTPSNEVTVDVPPAPALEIVKSSDVETITAVGETITYSFAVQNTGNVTVSDVVVNDVEFSGTGELSVIDCPVTTVAPGTTIICTATYVVTQADVDAGSITNAATADGTTPGGDPVEETPPSEVTVPVTQTPGLSIEKSGTIAGDEYVVGAVVTYSFVATNTGNTTLTDIVINEGEFSGTGELSDIVCPAEGAAALAPGAQVICTSTYALTQADIDAGEVTNTATSTGTPPGDTTPITSTPDDAIVPTPQDAGLSIVKTADVQQISTVGQEITFSFLITNTGNVSVTDPSVVEGEFSGTGELSAIECPADATLVPGQQVTCSATYQVTQADLDAGQLTNTATATGTTPGGDPVDPSDPSTVEVPTDPQPALTIVKTADKGSVVGVGQIITYTFVITNTGNVTINDARVVETDFSGSGELSAIQCAEEAAALAPGAQVECTATYTTTQADVNAGAISNTAVASGTPVTGGDPVPSDPSSISVEITAGTGLAITGGELATGVVGLAILLLVGGGVLMTIRRRRAEVLGE